MATLLQTILLENTDLIRCDRCLHAGNLSTLAAVTSGDLQFLECPKCNNRMAKKDPGGRVILLQKGGTLVLYPNLIKALSREILSRYPRAGIQLEQADKEVLKKNDGDNIPIPLQAYVLWMFDELNYFKDLLKADRWLGWALRVCENMEVSNLKMNRGLVRQDKVAVDYED